MRARRIPHVTVSSGLRPNRVQRSVCRGVLVTVLDPVSVEAVLTEAGISGLPDDLPEGPRDLAALAHELQPFVDLYRAVRARLGRNAALSVAREAIIRSAAAGFSRAAALQLAEVGAAGRRGEGQPADGPSAGAHVDAAWLGLDLTSPPPRGFQASADELRRRFDVSMEFFSCAGRLLEYTPDRVRFHVTACNWVRAMQNAGAPELIPFFCESDERFMDSHPTHRLDRPTAIGLGHTRCDFQFVPRNGKGEPAPGGTESP